MYQKDLVQILRAVAEQRGISMQTFSDDWVVRLSNATQEHWIIGQNFDLNQQANSVIANEKVASSALLAENNVPHVPHYLLNRHEQRIGELPSIESALATYGELVIKPLAGHSGRLVTKIQTIEQAFDAIRLYPDVTWAYGPYTQIESETRLVVLDGVVEVALQKMNPVSRDGLKLFNLSQGATAQHIDVQSAGVAGQLAIDAMRALGLRLAAVDIITTTDGHIEVLEVNATFSLMRYAKINDATYSEVASFYDRLIGTLFTEKPVAVAE